MKTDVVLPQMGESITEGTVAKWLKKAGERVERDESLLEITTDKIDSEIPSPADGVLVEILVQEGETVQVGAVLGRIESTAAEGRQVETAAQAPATEPTEVLEPETPFASEAATAKDSETRITPVARNIVQAEGLGLEELGPVPTRGPGSRITKQDVLTHLQTRSATAQRAAEQVPSEPAAPTLEYDESRVEIIEMSNRRKRIAEHMVHSKRVSPHTYNAAEVDMSRIAAFREREKKRFEREEGFKLTYNAFLLHAAVMALKAYPLMNSSVDGDRVIRKEYIHLGVAVAVEDGLLVPVIHDADEKNLLGLARSANELATRARTKKLSPDDLQGGTFTVTNPGVFGNVFGLPIIHQPQVGILGVGAVRKRPVVIQDAIGIRSMMCITLSYDHRIIDGAYAARFIQEVRSVLENYDIEQAL